MVYYIFFIVLVYPEKLKETLFLLNFICHPLYICNKLGIMREVWNANEKARKMKKAFCFNICSCHYLRQNLSTSDLSFSQVTSVEKREPRKHFSASACGLGFKNFFLGTLFSTSVTWEKLKSDVDKFFLRRGKNKYRNKILFLRILGDWKVFHFFFVLFTLFFHYFFHAKPDTEMKIQTNFFKPKMF